MMCETIIYSLRWVIYLLTVGVAIAAVLPIAWAADGSDGIADCRKAFADNAPDARGLFRGGGDE